ncbi:MAG TPA: hypothetical protein VK666_29910, partial [Chryseolinea sp.]|nr:hypothetical protein [Chryseolinea sp.]
LFKVSNGYFDQGQLFYRMVNNPEKRWWRRERGHHALLIFEFLLSTREGPARGFVDDKRKPKPFIRYLQSTILTPSTLPLRLIPNFSILNSIVNSTPPSSPK